MKDFGKEFFPKSLTPAVPVFLFHAPFRTKIRSSLPYFGAK